MRFLSAFLAIFILSACQSDIGEKQCFPIGDGSLVKSCRKGDIITVSTKTYKFGGLYSVSDDRVGKIYADDVSAYCSFEHPIIYLGTTQINIKFSDVPDNIAPFNQSWFNCVYLGKMRDFR